MNRIIALLMLLILTCPLAASARTPFAADTIKTSAGDLIITFIGHGSLMFDFAGRIIQVDPFSKLADYSTLPRADIILITHDHYDHLDLPAVNSTRKASTEMVLTETCARQVKGGIVMHNNEVKTVQGVKIEAVPAYNLIHKRDNTQPFHPKGEGNGYILTFGDKRIYVAGDTENTPEMKALRDIDVAFLPMNLPYTMTPAMVADAARAFRPKILYPYHYGETDTAKLVDLLKDDKDIEIRIRPMQ
ncbi:MAG: MBL fold metallo-hydrolase [Thermodesulfobacteriota bacterium]